MKTRTNRLMKISFLFLLSVSLLSNTSTLDSRVAEAVGDDSYYTSDNGIDITGQSGETLLQNLKQITTVSQFKTTTYAEVRDYTKYSDADPDIPGNIILFYAGASISGTWDNGNTWNREHVWCQSLSGGLYGESGAGSDLHHIRPAASKINSTRSNTLYGEVDSFSGTVKEISYNDEPTGNFYIGDEVFEPRDGVKGDAVRILMYLYTRYYDAGTLKINNIITTPAGTEAAAWDLALKWNELDPVDDFEMARNDYIYTLQGNRNPFIDHSEFANMLFDPNYSGAGALVDTGGGSTGETIPVTGISLSSSTLALNAGNSERLTATVTPSNATNRIVSWSSSNTSVATVTSTGSVTGIGAGTATITASIGGFSATCEVTVSVVAEGEYTKLTSVAAIDETADYVLGLDGTGFHYSGTSSWGRVALPSAQEPIYYKLTITSVEDSTFTALGTVDGSPLYLTVPSSSNSFSMTPGSSTLRLGGSSYGDDQSICNESTPDRHLRYNSTGGLRSYASSTGNIAYFYKVVDDSPDVPTDPNKTLADAFLARLTSLSGHVTVDDKDVIAQIETDYANLTSEVKAYVDEGGYQTLITNLLNELQGAYQTEANTFLARLTSLSGHVTVDDKDVIAQIETDYANLTSEVKAYVDAGGYQTLITNLLNELQGAYQTEANTFLARLTSLQGNVTIADESVIAEIQSDYANLSSEVKALVDAGGYATLLAGLLNELQGAYQAEADTFLARLTSLRGNVTTDDEATIEQIKDDYANLSDKVKPLVDAGGYAELIAELDQELENAHIAKAQVVVNIIEALPNASEIDGTNYKNYEEAIAEANNAYEALTAGEKASVSNYSKLVELMAKLASIEPEWIDIVDGLFLNGATLPTGWTGNSVSAFATNRLAFRSAGAYLEYGFNDSSIVSSQVKVQVYAVTNNASAINTLTVYGYDAEGNVVDSQTFQPYSQVATNQNAIDNACSEANSRTVVLTGNISSVRVQLTTRDSANTVVREIKVSYLEDTLLKLIDTMNTLNTCTDYERASEIRAIYNTLSTQDKATFDATICAEDANCTMENKLAYMEQLYKNAQSGSSTALSPIDKNNEGMPMTLIVLVAILGLSSVVVYYFINKKKLQA